MATPVLIVHLERTDVYIGANRITLLPNGDATCCELSFPELARLTGEVAHYAGMAQTEGHDPHAS